MMSHTVGQEQILLTTIYQEVKNLYDQKHVAMMNESEQQRYLPFARATTLK